MNLIETLKQREVAALQTNAQTYYEIVLATAKGENVDADDAAKCIKQLGKSASDFAADVELAKRRIRWSENLSAAADARHESKDVEAAIRIAGEEFEEVKKKHLETMRPLIDRHAELVKLQAGQTQDERRLRETVLNPDLIASRVSLEKSQAAALSRVEYRQKSMQTTPSSSVSEGSIAYRHEQAVAKLASMSDSRDPNGYAAQQKHVAELNELRDQAAAELREAEQELQGIRSELDDLNQLAMQP